MGIEPRDHHQGGDDPTRYANEVEHYRRMVDSTKSFTSQAILTLVLYILLWLPGLIANIVFLNEARSIERRTGRAPEGKGCLLWLLIVMGGLIGLGCVVYFVAFVAILGESST